MEKELINKGWTILQNQQLDDEGLLKIASKFGTPFPDSNNFLVQELKAKNKHTGIIESFSYNYGLDAFPYHTDTAFIEIPARYLLLTSLFESKTTTNLIDLKDCFDKLSSDELKIFEKSIFLLSTPIEKKFTSLMFNHDGLIGIRYDPNIMTPYNSSSKIAIEILNAMIKKSESNKINWNQNQILILDNWRCVHSRSRVEDKVRILKRIYIR